MCDGIIAKWHEEQIHLSLDLKQISEADVYHIEILWMIYFICVQDHFDTNIIVI